MPRFGIEYLTNPLFKLVSCCSFAADNLETMGIMDTIDIQTPKYWNL